MYGAFALTVCCRAVYMEDGGHELLTSGSAHLALAPLLDLLNHSPHVQVRVTHPLLLLLLDLLNHSPHVQVRVTRPPRARTAA